MPELIDLTASAAAAAIRDGRLRSLDLVEACLARIAARDAQLRAFARLAPDARERARRADETPAKGPLHGVPVAIKDIIDTAGLGTECGSPIHRGRVPSADADCVRRLTAAGAIVIGKAETTEFAFTTPAPTANPLDLRRSPGGSSSGSAAAVADRMAPIALGTQTGGSVIRPASFCGLFGFKSSVGRTDLRGVQEQGRSCDTIGWFARSAEDLALLGAVLLTPARAAAQLPARPRLARLATPFDAKASPAMRAACDGVAARLAASGAEVTSLALPPRFAALDQAHLRIVSVEAARACADYLREAPELLSPGFAAFLREGQINEAYYADAQRIVASHRADLARLQAGIDALILPAAPDEAPLGLDTTGDAIFNRFLSALRPPCATLPAARGPSGMPLGVQLVGRIGEDEALLALVQWAAARL